VPEQQPVEDGQSILVDSDAVSWWRWRPGAKPPRALLLGGVLSLLALFVLLNAVATLVADALDSSSAPLQVLGIVRAQNTHLPGSPQLTIHLTRTGFPASITLVVSRDVAAMLATGAPVVLDYAPHQHTPYALESHGQRYLLPGGGPFDNLAETLALLFFGLLLLPYPLLLSIWGWRDLHARQYRQCTGQIVALRAARQTTTRTPGLVPRTTHIWHGIALQVEHALPGSADPEILVFGVDEEVYRRCKRGDRVQVTYSPYLHYLSTLTSL